MPKLTRSTQSLLLPDPEEDEMRRSQDSLRTFLLINLTTSPLSTLQRAYIPALLQSRLSQNFKSPESIVLRLRSLGSFLSILTMPVLAYVSSSKLLRSIIFIMSLCSILFGFPVILPQKSQTWGLLINKVSYVILLSFTALYESCLSSIIPSLIEKGISSQISSAKGMVFSDIGAITVLVVGFLMTYFGVRLEFCVMLVGLTSLIMCLKIKGLGAADKVRMIKFRKNIVKYSLAWGIWNCGMVNFMVIMNMKYKKFIERDAFYAGFMIWSFTCAMFGAWIWMRVGTKTFKWVHTLNALIICVYIFVLISGMCRQWQFWVVECVYIALSGAFRSLNRALYSDLLPEGEEAQYFGLEILIGLVGNWIIGGLASIVKTKLENDGFCLSFSLVMSIVSSFIYGCCKHPSERNENTELE